MKAILIKNFGPPENLYIGEAPIPQISNKEILVQVKATAINRADTLQRKGLYPPPPGESEILGLEMAGEVVEIGSEVSKWKKGDRVCGLLAGGGYAEFVKINEALVFEIPQNLNYEEAAAIPEVFLTAYQALFYLSKLQKDESVLIHAGASGVGTAAIQLAKKYTDKIFITASKPKHALCKSLGVSTTIDYKSQNFEEEILNSTNGKGVDVIIDFLAASYLQQNINSLNFDGRMVLLAFLGGVKVSDLNLANILRKRLTIMGSTLRARSLEYKAKLINDFTKDFLPSFQEAKIKPVIYKIVNWTEVVQAHEMMEANLNQGKIVLKLQ